ncbi:MAG: hypothetical protein ACFB10_07485 [Salibacteraceae bacterium]
MNRILRPAFFALVFFFAACQGGSKTGGPCDYKQTPFQATVSEIATGDDGKIAVKLEFNVSTLAMETQDLSDFITEEVTQEMIDKRRIKVGNVYLGTVSEINSGSCQPVVVSFDSDFSVQ